MRRSVLVASSCIVLQSLFAHAQTITSIQVAPDGGIILTWDSQADVAYRVDYAPQITSPMDWRELYGNYASHGSSTFWKDVGNEGIYPPASHPRDDSSRFYRVVAVDTNS